MGSGFFGAKTNYVFSTSNRTECNERRGGGAARQLFGENSTARLTDASDGTSNTIAMAETTLPTFGGHATNWGYRGIDQVGLSLGTGGGLNRWNVSSSGAIELGHRMGPLTVGSYHGGGASVVLADGSVRFLAETTPFVTREALRRWRGAKWSR